MKKLVSVLCVVVCTISLCLPVSAADSRAYSLYQNAVAEFNENKSIQLQGVLEMGIQLDRYNYSEQLMWFELDRIKTDEGIEMKHTAHADGMAPDTMYYKGGVYYYRTYANAKEKMRERELAIKDSLLIHKNLIKLSESQFQNAAVSTTDDGYRVSLGIGKYDILGMPELFEFLEDMDWGITYSSDATFWFDKSGRLTRYQVNTVYYDPEDDTSFNTQLKITILSRNKLKSIDFPNDLNSYTWA